MGKIGDLWVRLGMKSEDYKKGIKEANKETEGFGNKLGKVKAGALAVWAAIGASIVKVAQDTIKATNAMGDAWEQNMSKVKSSYRSVIAQLSTNSKREKGWWLRLFNPEDNAGAQVGANAKAAGDAAAKMTEAFDAEFELINSVKLQKAAIQQELNDLYVQMRDTTLSPQARQAAMERYKALLEPIAQAEIQVYQNMLNAAVEGWQAGNMDILSRQYSTAELTDFFSIYGTNPNAAKEKYGELASVYELRQNDEFNALLVDTMLKLKGAQNQMSDLDKEMGRTSVSIKKALEDMFKIDGKSPDALFLQTTAELIKEIKQGLQEIDDLDLDFDIDAELGLEEIDQEIKDFLAAWSNDMQQIEALNGMLENAIVSATTNGLQALTDMMFGLEDADMKQVLAAFLSPFADTLKQMGSMIMAEGIAMDAFKKSFSNPYAAIAAGAALIAVGSAVSSGLRALTANPAGGAGTSASYGGNSTVESQNYESTLTIEVTGKISGSDIILAGSKTQNKWNR